MALETLVAYGIALGLPVWLIAEEIIYRIGVRRYRFDAPSAAEPKKNKDTDRRLEPAPNEAVA